MNELLLSMRSQFSASLLNASPPPSHTVLVVSWYQKAITISTLCYWRNMAGQCFFRLLRYFLINTFSWMYTLFILNLKEKKWKFKGITHENNAVFHDKGFILQIFSNWTMVLLWHVCFHEIRNHFPMTMQCSIYLFKAVNTDYNASTRLFGSSISIGKLVLTVLSTA